MIFNLSVDKLRISNSAVGPGLGVENKDNLNAMRFMVKKKRTYDSKKKHP